MAFNINELLNGASLAESPEEKRQEPQYMGVDKVVRLSVFDLVPSKDNFYSVKQIEDIKNSIEIFGVKQNLNVEPLGNGKYKVVAGHRRRLGSIALVEEGKPEYEFVPCAIEGDDDLMNRLLLIQVNSTTRKLSDWEEIEQAKQARSIIEELQAQTDRPERVRAVLAKILNMTPEELPRKSRDVVAKMVGKSSAQVGRMEAVAKNLIPEFREELKAERVNFSTAYELSGLSSEEQAKAFEDYQQSGGVHIKDVKALKVESAAGPTPASSSAPPPEEHPEEVSAADAEEQEEAPATMEVHPTPQAAKNASEERVSSVKEQAASYSSTPERERTPADTVSVAIAKITELNEKGAVKRCYLHRDYETGALQLNFEFDADAAEKVFSDKEIKEIDSSAYWE